MEFTSQIGSPGLGVTPIRLSAEPLATEAEATRGPPDEVDTDEIAGATLGEMPEPRLQVPDGLNPPEPAGFELPDFGGGF